MKRIDSGFYESLRSYNSHDGNGSSQRSSQAPPRRQNSITPSPASLPSAQPTDMASQQSPPEVRPRLSYPHSRFSSSRNSRDQIQSRRNNSSSKPCSSRTSRSGVHPSQSSRHHRIQSSHTVPTTASSRHPEDPIALHFRSYSLFQNPSYSTPHAGLPSTPSSQPGTYPARPSTASRLSTDIEPDIPEHTQDLIPSPSPSNLNTPMHWNSPSTRARDYKRIQRANSGLRGILNRALPRCVFGAQEKFYEHDESDAGSVRRYRLDEFEGASGEKDVAGRGKCAFSVAAFVKRRMGFCF